MIYINGSDKKGQDLIKRYSTWEGDTLSQVYDSWCDRKQADYDRWYDEYLETPEHAAFSICTHNAYAFTVSWVGVLDGRDVLRIETAKHSYCVWLDD